LVEAGDVSGGSAPAAPRGRRGRPAHADPLRPQSRGAAGTADGNPSGHHRLGAEGPLDADDPIVTMVGIAV